MSSSEIVASTPIPALRESTAIALIGAVQFVNILDFMMVMPMGPDLAQALDIETSRIGLIGGSYTAAAALAGIAGSFFLDRFDRRKALVFALVGLALGTFAGALAFDLNSLLAARVLAGAFGGPATAVGVAIIADVVPPERRGSAMGKVMGAFALASILGVPVGLELARHFGFRMPFLAVGSVTVLAAGAAYVVLPPLTKHLMNAANRVVPSAPFDAATWMAISSSALVMMGNFALIPNFSAYLQFNLGYPRAGLSTLYMVGGAAAFFAMRGTGTLVDRFGSARLVVAGTALYVLVALGFFYSPILTLAPAVGFAGFMVANSVRMVPLQSLASRVPALDHRARFLSTQSAVQHMASSFGAMAASSFLTETADHRLVGLERIALVSVSLAAIVPLLTFAVERSVRAREAAQRT